MKLKLKDIIVYLLILYSILVLLLLGLLFIAKSPEFVTHEQFGASVFALGSAMVAGFYAFWLKLTDFAKELGELKGTLNEFIRSQSSKKHRK